MVIIEEVGDPEHVEQVQRALLLLAVTIMEVRVARILMRNTQRT